MLSGKNIFYAISWAYFLFVVFFQLGDYQLELFDEGRRGVSALEMYTGRSHILVPTYADLPEHWGTKPTLLIWLQTAAVALLGPNEWAIRLPAALATLSAIGLLAWFSSKQWKSAIVGTLAGWILLSNWNFIGSHGARSGDFDALLLLFCLAQVLFYYQWIKTARLSYLILAALGLLLAGWTKGIAGCLFLPAIGLWTLLDTTARKQILNWKLYAAFGTALIGILAYYGLREMVDEGYLQLVWNNELGGRYLNPNDGHVQPWYHYLEVLYNDRPFFLFTLLAIPGTIAMLGQRKEKSLGLLLLVTVLGFLSVISISATKLFWYVAPALPFIALITAWLLVVTAKHLVDAQRYRLRFNRRLLAIVFIGLFFFSPVQRIITKVWAPEQHLGMQSQLSYKAGIQSTAFETPFTVLTPNYHANARFYVEQQKILGRDIEIKPITPVNPPRWSVPNLTVELTQGARVLLCENNSWLWMSAHYDYQELTEVSPCKLVYITGKKED